MTTLETEAKPSDETVNGIPFDKFENDPPLMGSTGYVVSEDRAPDYIKVRRAEVLAQRMKQSPK